MDGRDFDDMTRRLALGRSRRSVLKGVIGGVAVLAGGRAGTALAGPKDKVAICHLTGNGQAHLITVSQSALPAHLAHGDGYLGTDAHCSACGEACAGNAACIHGACVTDDAGCKAGYGPDANGDCMLCPIGTASAAGLACDPCPVNTFADLVGQAVCVDCPDRTSTNGQTGQASCIDDNNGGTCKAGSVPGEMGDCVDCPVGTASADGLACVACPVDTFAAFSGQAVCTECPEGTSTNGQTGQASCVTDQVTCASTSTCGPLCDSSNNFVADCTEGCTDTAQCWWLSNSTGEWESAYWVSGQQECRDEDSCGCGGGGHSGGCYKWANEA
jgi:hypothetical protein